jgi:hypothetical protein
MSELEEFIDHLISGKTWRPKTLASSIERQFINPKIVKLQAENDKLREALELIVLNSINFEGLYSANMIIEARKTLEELK